MSTHMVCPICGKKYECDGPHNGPHNVLSSIEECPLSKGSIYVFVKDERGEKIPKVKTYCNDASTTTDEQGYAYFEKLDAGEPKYTTRIAFDESDASVISKYYVEHRISVDAKVEKGKITMVEFVLNQYAAMSVKLEGAEKEMKLPGAKFGVSSEKHTPEPSSEKAVDGEATFNKLKPTELYKVTCELDNAKDFQLEKDEVAGQKVKTDEVAKVIFRVKPRFWVELALVHKNDPGLKGGFALKHAEKGSLAANDVGSEASHVADLSAGKIDIDGVTLPVSGEFAGIS